MMMMIVCTVNRDKIEVIQDKLFPFKLLIFKHIN